MTTAEKVLRDALVGYLCEGHRSREQIRALEGLLPEELEVFPWYDDLAVALALYNPGGGSEYVDDHALETEIKYVLIQMGESVEDC